MNTSPAAVEFPLKELTKLTEDSTPNAFEIQNLKKEVIGNVRAIHTSLGGGAHGHTGLVIPAAEYAAIIAGVAGAVLVPWATPAHPVMAHLPGNAGEVATVNAQITYQTSLNTYTTCIAVEAQIKKMIIDAVPRIYLEAVEDPVYGFGNVTAETILTHLVTTYGTISQKELEDNLEHLTDAFNPDEAIEKFLSAANKRLAFATAGGEPIPDGLFIRQLLKAFEKSGVMSEGLKDWYKKPTADQTRANFGPHFTTANKERKRMMTIASAGYGSANAATNKPATTTAPAESNAIAEKNSGMYYCWTHGLGHSAKHTSKTCTAKSEGHVKESHAADMKGGNNTIRRKRGEKPVYKRNN